ncbi:MAG: carbohydrate kinase [Paraprevotella sp.]|nr:carbohydrate kinase [Paraprevotella sp.]
MRKVIGMGETIMDIIFHGAQPTAAVPGGSSFNSIISIGRAGIPAVFIGEPGRDEVGRRIADFLKANHVDARYLRMRDDIQSAVSLAFLDEHHDAHYMFYKQPPSTLPDFAPPEVEADDVVQFGSYYAINPHIRTQVRSFLKYARRNDAILYYDLNYRRTYKDRIRELLPSIRENFRLADLARGSADDFDVMYGLRDAETIYRTHVAPYCPLFICTQGADSIVICTPQGVHRYPVPPLQTVSTIGAGDNFNAGFIYGLMRYGIGRSALHSLSPAQCEQLTDCGRIFSANVCASIHNSIDEDFGRLMAQERSEQGKK